MGARRVEVASGLLTGLEDMRSAKRGSETEGR